MCDQKLADNFYAGCREQKLGGNATVWNRFLQRLNAAGELPTPTEKLPQLTADQLEAIRPAAETAWRLLAIDFEQTLLQILTAPKLAAEFDRLAKIYGDESVAPRDYRLAAFAIGNQANQIREAANSLLSSTAGSIKFEEHPISDSLFAQSDRLPEQTAGVYVLRSEDAAVYVGHSRDVRKHCEDLLNKPSWAKLNIDSIGLIADPDADQRKLIQVALVQQEHAFLNCRLLMQDSEL